MAYIEGNDGNNVLRGDRSYPNEEDYIDGLGGNDVLSGLGGYDELHGGGGDDTLHGGTGDDRLYGGEGADRMYGGAGNDELSGGGGGDLLDGGDGNDLCEAYGGTVLGGAGDDAVRYRSSIEDAYTVDGGAGMDVLAAIGDVSNLTISGFEHLGSIGGFNLRITAAQLNAFVSVSHNSITLTTAGNVGANFLSDNESTGNDIVGSSGSDSIDLSHVVRNWAITDGTGDDGDTLIGGSGNDSITGWYGDDLLRGGAGDDFLKEEGGDNTLEGGAGNDVLVSTSSGVDLLDGGDGGDFIDASDGDTILGGNDDDIVSLRNLSGEGGGTADGGAGTDRLSATNGDITGFALSGFEELSGRSLRVTAAQLNAFASVALTSLTLAEAGSVGDNFVADLFEGGAGYAQITGSSSADTIDLSHVVNAWKIIGGGGDDGDTLIGGSGNDTITGWYGDDLVRGGAGNDSLLGYDGDNTLEGGAGNDILSSGEGDDRLDGGAGADVMSGGSGNDVYIVDNARDRVFESDGDGAVFVSVDWTLTAGQAVGSLISSGSGGITLKGNQLANFLVSGTGSDRLEGGRGNDIYSVNGAGDQVVEAADGGLDFINTTVSWVLAEGSNVEGLDGDDAASAALALTGNSSDNRLSGGGGADILRGLAGNDVYGIDDTRDRVVEAASGGSDTVYVEVSYALAATAEVEVLSAYDARLTTPLNLTGSNTANLITGNAGTNVLSGLGGADTMKGGGGNDTYLVHDAADQVVEAAGGGTDTVQSLASFTLGANVESLTLLGTGHVDGRGNNLANAITGNRGSNVLAGGAGNDTLTGGVGTDAFVFDTAPNAATNADVVEDFSVPNDTIRLDDLVFRALGAPGALAADAFRVGAAAADTSDRIIYDAGTGELFYDADGSGSRAAAVQFAVIDNKAALTHADFLVV